MAAAVVQSTSAEAGATTAPTLTLSGVVAGNLLIAICGTNGGAPTIATSSPTETWALAKSQAGTGSAPFMRVDTAVVATAGSHTVTFHAVSGNWYTALIEVSGADIVDVTGSQQDNTLDASYSITGSGTLAQSGELILATWVLVGNLGTSPTAGSGYALITACTQAAATFKPGFVEQQHVTATTTPTATATCDTDQHSGILLTIKDAAAAAGVSVTTSPTHRRAWI